MKDRIKDIRKSAEKTQKEFADKLNLSQNYIAQIEMGSKTPSDRTISDICREFNVNEEWLRYGKGEKYLPQKDDTAQIVSSLLLESNPLYDMIVGIMKTYQKLDDKSQQAIKDFGKKLLEELKKEG